MSGQTGGNNCSIIVGSYPYSSLLSYKERTDRTMRQAFFKYFVLRVKTEQCFGGTNPYLSVCILFQYPHCIGGRERITFIYLIFFQYLPFIVETIDSLLLGTYPVVFGLIVIDNTGNWLYRVVRGVFFLFSSYGLNIDMHLEKFPIIVRLLFYK